MDKKTTAEVAQALGITKSKIHQSLHRYPALRPAVQTGNSLQFLWSEEEIAALRIHLAAHPKRGKVRKDWW